ncbi:MAG: tRNA-dihydrouridine synthase [Euryarchaeota archaeon]|nr:tRNA-dihydrouridine synthase [Euryarchaeota archaeon]MBU4547877.1 tRNA-dihydrouridine synthase [Euryarchaeota archaeon]MBU4608464.1 tRNA-dihydrouridine synthase [Euryarchaeota archaeon]MBV1755303.1 tRNA-dihydrouridine synthase [Methanobacterium sp.]MBV1767654.1 tRNA-dihydrouridine synthase [Methanobacterium sp.]
MAGITNADFCLKLIPYGFDMVTLGGYNADKPTIDAGKKIMGRGRLEFDISEGELIYTIEKEANKIKENWDGKLSVNIRSLTPDSIIEISKLKKVDVVEINAHCRQKEITSIGCGQALLTNPDFMEEFALQVVKKSKSKVSVKIRTHVAGVDELKMVQIIEDIGADFIHVDAMKPGLKEADLDLIKKIKSRCSIFIIGNNSITDLDSAQKMIDSGAQGISIARAALGGKLNFDLSKIRLS